MRDLVLRYKRKVALAILALAVMGCGLSTTLAALTPAVSATAEVTILPYTSPTGALTATPVSSPPAAVVAQALGEVNLRAGPGTNNSVVGQLTTNQSVPVVGRTEDGSWFVVSWPDGPDGRAWVYRDVVSLSGDASSLPVATAPPTAIPSATASTQASSGPQDTQQASSAGATSPAEGGTAATPFGCQKPVDDYTIVSAGDKMVINRRTYTMLTTAQGLYAGTHNFIKSITQGSYSPGLPASFGTHDGGGAVDISVRDPDTWAVLTDQLQPMVTALREAGFAAWVREEGELSQGSPIHIHMIAIGDKDLSPAARRQVDGKEGYFRGFNGLPVDPPAPDKWGPPILCPWMVELGYADLRGTP